MMNIIDQKRYQSEVITKIMQPVYTESEHVAALNNVRQVNTSTVELYEMKLAEKDKLIKQLTETNLVLIEANKDLCCRLTESKQVIPENFNFKFELEK